MELLDLFIRRLASKGSSASKNTIKNYISDVRHFMNWYEKSMKTRFEANSVTSDVISLYQKSMGATLLEGSGIDISSKLGVASMKRHMSSLRKFFTVLKEESALEYNPFDNLEAELDETPTDYWHLRSFADFLTSSKASKITVKSYVSDIQGFAKWYEQAVLPGIASPLTSTGGFYLITQDILNEYKDRLVQVQNAAPRTINRKLSALRRYVDFAQKKGFISEAELYLNPIHESNRRVYEAAQPKVKLREIRTDADTLVKNYSPFPPFRLIQRIFIYPYLSFEITTANIIASIIAGKPVEGLQKLPQKLQKEITDRNYLRKSGLNASTILGVTGIQKEFYEPHRISLLGKPLHHKVIHHLRFTRPSWYQKYHNYPFVHYAHFALLILFATGVGVALYNNLVGQEQRQASAAPTGPSRVLSFQGRLTDNLDNPITTPQQVRFMIYNDASATDSANLWEELRTVQPDQDGIFSVVLGSDSSGNNGPDCSPFPLGSPATDACEIPSTVFSDNSGTWLGVTIENTPELAPRQRIATVAYASNSEFLQGLPPITSLAAADPKTNTVLALDSSGNLTIGGDTNPAPIFQATDGQFTLSGQVLLLRTVTGTDTNVVLSPDGFGKVDLTKALVNTSLNGNLSPGAVEVNDKFAVLATESAVAAFTINNDTTGGDIFTASSSGTTRFTIANDGQVIGSYYSVNGGIIYTTNGIFNQTTAGSGGQCLQSAGGGTPTWGTCGSGGNWNIALGTIYPINETLDLLVGGTTTDSAKFRVLNMSTGTPVASVSANSGNNATFISGGGNIGTTNRQTLNIGNASGFNTTGNVLFNSNGVGNIGFFTTTPRASFDVRGISGTQAAASISANTSFAALVIDNQGTGDFLTASKGGQTYFRISAENGNYFGTDYDGTFTVGKGGNGKLTALVIDPVIVSNQKTTGTQSLTLHTSGSTNADFIFQNVSTELARLSQAGQLSLAIQGSTGGLAIGGDTHIYRGDTNRLDLATGDSFNIVNGSLLVGGNEIIDETGAGTFTNLTVTGTCSGCGAAGEISPFQELTGAIVPLNSTLDLLIGGQSTDSAKFAVLNVADGVPSASVSAGINGASYLTAAGNLQTTANQKLTIGGSTTGTVQILERLQLEFGGTFFDQNNNRTVLQAENGVFDVLNEAGNAWGTLKTGTIYGGGNANGNLTIRTTTDSTKGNLVLADDGGRVGVGTNSPIGEFHVTRGLSLGATGKALVIFDQIENQDIFTASSSGTTRFTIQNDGDIVGSGTLTGITGLSSAGTITFSGFAGANDGGVIYANSSGVLSQTGAGSGSQCLLGGPTPSWGSCGTGTTSSPFQELAGAIVPLNSTLDTLLGGQSSASATLRVLGSENPFAGTEVATFISSQTSAAGLVVENSGVGNILAASSSGATRFSIDNSGNTNLFAQADLRFMDADSSNYVGFQAPTTVGSNVVWTLPDADGTGCFQSNGAGELSISTCGSGGESFWNVTDGVLHPGNSTLDLAIGGTSSTSAKFLFANVNSGDPTLQIFNSNSTQSLDLYHDGTNGNIISSTGTLNLGLGGGTLYLETDIVNDTTNFDGAVKVADKLLIQNSEAAGTALAVFDNTGAGDILAASASGTPRFAVTSAGGIKLGTSEGNSGQCLQSGGAGFTAAWGPCASQTPWTSDIDADGFDLTDLSNLEFRDTTGAPAGTITSIFRDNTGDLNLNALSAKTINLQVNGTDEYNFSSTALAMNGNNITGVGTDITAAAGLTISTTTTGILTLDSGTTGAINIGTGANAKTITIGNTSSTTGIDINVGSGELDLGDTTGTKTIEIGGVDNSGTDTIRIATNGSSPDTIEIGNTNATLSLTGNNWNIDSSGNIDLGGILQVGNTTGTTYSRLGTGTAGHSLSGAEDLLVSGDLEVNGTAWFDGNINITGTCTGCGGGGAFDVLGTGVTVQKNQSTDLLIGSSSTSSAKFAVLNVAGGTPTASVSAGTTGATYLTAAGTLQTTAGQSLTLGGNTTGNILINGLTEIGSSTTGLSITTSGIISDIDGNVVIEDQVILGSTANGILIDTSGNISDINNSAVSIADSLVVNGTSLSLGAGGGDVTVRHGDVNGSLNFRAAGTGEITLETDHNSGLNIGSSTSTPAVLSVSGGLGSNAALILDQLNNADIFTASSSGITKFVLTNSGSIGLGLTDAPVGKLRIPEAKLDVWSNLGTSPVASFSGNTSDAILKIVQNGSGDLIVASKSGATYFRVTGDSGDDGGTPFAGELHVGLNGTGKIYAGVQDPPYTIDGVKFATYAPSVLGLYEEFIGKTVIEYDEDLKAYAQKLEFNNFEPHSDLWVFNRIIDQDITDIKITMTPNSNARTWYKKDGVNRTIILYSDRPTEISYRLSALRFNHGDFPTLRNSGPIGYIPPPPVTTGDSSGNNNINSDPFFNTLVINHQNGQWRLYDANNNELNFIEAYSKAIIANIQAGLVNAQQITTNGFTATTGFIGNLSGNTLTFATGSFNNISSAVSNLGSATASTLAITTNNVTIAGQSLSAYVETIVANYLAGQPISPLASSETIQTNVLSPLADSSAPSVSLQNSRVNINNGTDTVSWFDREGNASFSGTLTSNRIKTYDASVSGNLAAGNIQTENIETTDASVSGTLRTNNLIADNIQGLDEKIGTLAAVLSGNYQNSSSGSGEYSSLFAGIVNATSITADFGIFEQGITSMGPITASHITAIDTLSVGSNLTISNNAINTLGAELAFQSLRQADITFQGGLIRMDTDGNMTIAGNLNLLGEIDAVFGIFSGSVTTPALATNLITPLPGNDITLKLTQKNASNSARFIVANNQGQEVLSINDRGDITSSGAATLSKLNFNLVGEAQASTLTEAIATGSAGFATLRAYQPEITVKNPNVTKDSLIYITPFGDTDKVLYLLRQQPQTDDEEGSFTVGASGQLPTQNIQFNWLIVN